MFQPRIITKLATALVVSLCVVAYVHAQTATSPRVASTTTAMSAHGFKASDVIGQSVYTMDDQEKGKIKDLMMNERAKIRAGSQRG